MHEQRVYSEVAPVKDAFCFQNALNAMFLLNQKYPAELTQIYSVDTPKGTHAYLVHYGAVYNKGVTWTNEYYPNYSLEEIQEQGKDVTVDLLEQVLEIQDDIHSYGRFIRKQFGESGILYAEELYSQLTGG